MTTKAPIDWASRLPMELIRAAGQRYGIDPLLLAAICIQESGGNRFAQRFEPAYKYYRRPEDFARALPCSLETETSGQATSYGLMQVMGAVMREYGFSGWFGEAFNPEINIDHGARHLANFLKRYDTPSAIASYNAGAPRTLVMSTKFKNQDYVDSVLKHWDELKAGMSK